MTGGKLDRAELKERLAALRGSLPLTECATCECLLGYLTQLEIDAGEGAAALTGTLKDPEATLHGCLGCDPCPPAEQFADYLSIQKATGGGAPG